MGKTVIQVILDMSNAAYLKAVKAAQRANERFGKKSKMTFSQMKSRMLGVAAAVGGIALAFKKLMDITHKQMKAEVQLNAALKSTQHVAGLTFDELKNMAIGLQRVTAFGDEVTMQGQALLLTFTKIGRDVFPQATETMLNMATAMGTDLRTQAIMLGKALNDPIQGLSALRRVGVQLSQQQEEQVRRFMALGQIAKAQKVILGELETQFGGLARAMGDTAWGSMQRLGNATGDLVETFGNELQPILKEIADSAIESAHGMDEMARSAGRATAGWLELFNADVASAIVDTTLKFGSFVSLIGPAYKLFEKLGNIFHDNAEETRAVNREWQAAQASGEGIAGSLFDVAANAEAGIEVLIRYRAELEAIGNSYRNLSEVGTTFNNMLIDTLTTTGTPRGGGRRRRPPPPIVRGGGGGDRPVIDPNAAFMQEYQEKKKILLGFHEYKLSLEEFSRMKRREQEGQDRQSYEQLIRFKMGMDTQAFEAAKMFANMGAALMASKNKKIFRVGQALAIANATISASEAVMKGFSYGPFIGVPYAALVGTALAMNLARITSQKPPEMATGTWQVPRDMNANIHKGEQIIPKPIADSIRSGQATLGGGGASQQPIIVQVDGQTLFEINEKRRTDQANMMGASNYSQRSIYA